MVRHAFRDYYLQVPNLALIHKLEVTLNYGNHSYSSKE